MHYNHKLSIIMPVYNEEQSVAAILEKVIHVELPDGVGKELIIVNDCSADRSEREIMAVIRRHPEVE
ncbi:MAG: glycosyltransferase, partial [Tannerellaceae bacterium]|nr:glycosyltransferase [Tannerellaceae bacterium]